ncbi:hypothetical protein GCG54_00008929 [Colletotrichum gloeosporioides]|uniref:Uncharacterized protein n=1 Tax=Colletotrichum gloeosporioides TaxID=474922 RepID=A0A8H4FM92_COLGL|nr:uncharacterized protein GCG54_00008929 [Colletotrichum gloeosporioides]KAF3807468.1 hypothetical protein GCG54_00008929 [Colletotrichum gloeosporioides]
MTRHAPRRTATQDADRIKRELSPTDYTRIIPFPTAYVQFWCKVIEICFTASDALSKLAKKEPAPMLDVDAWVRRDHKKACDGLREWARHNRTTVSRIPREFFPSYSRDSNYDFRRPEDDQDGMNIDDLIAMISAWLPSYTAQKVEHHYYLATKRTLRIIGGLDVGEVEQIIPSSMARWTSGGLWLSKYKWRLYARCEIDEDDSYLYSEITFFLTDLPKQLEKGIQWTDDARVKDREKLFRRQGYWEHHSEWMGPGNNSSWYALTRIKSVDDPSAMTQDPRSFFSQCRTRPAYKRSRV